MLVNVSLQITLQFLIILWTSWKRGKCMGGWSGVGHPILEIQTLWTLWCFILFTDLTFSIICTRCQIWLCKPVIGPERIKNYRWLYNACPEKPPRGSHISDLGDLWPGLMRLHLITRTGFSEYCLKCFCSLFMSLYFIWSLNSLINLKVWWISQNNESVMIGRGRSIRARTPAAS